MVELGLLCRWRVGNLVLTFPVHGGLGNSGCGGLVRQCDYLFVGIVGTLCDV